MHTHKLSLFPLFIPHPGSLVDQPPQIGGIPLRPVAITVIEENMDARGAGAKRLDGRSQTLDIMSALTLPKPGVRPPITLYTPYVYYTLFL